MKKHSESLRRRTFLKAASAFAGSSLFGGVSFKAFAQQAQGLAPADHCFVFAYFSGGWDALLNLDLPMIMATVMYAAFFVVVANAVVDLLYLWLDPRVRHA